MAPKCFAKQKLSLNDHLTNFNDFKFARKKLVQIVTLHTIRALTIII